MKRLVVTADDFGLSSGVVEGIVEAHELGIVTSTSLMVNAPAADAAFEEARRLPSLATGLHFVLTFGRPVGPREPLRGLLSRDGVFRRNGSGAQESARPDEVREELHAQLAAFEKGVGRPPTHIDGHHHVHLHDGILRVAIEEAAGLGIPLRSRGFEVRERLRLKSIRTCDRFIDDFYGADVSEARLLSILETLPDGTSELMCHPAREDGELASLSSYAEPRTRELETLTSPSITQALVRLGIELVPMSRI
ncbi:MAG TPA: carbohydrate deacetylase [Vicinamibacteria bacterium]|nr:carbohydrate deacetylase [Vicinamibacteria bacterium]